MKLFKKKSLRANVLIEMSVVFPLVILAVFTLLVVVVFCYMQSKMKIESEFYAFSSLDKTQIHSFMYKEEIFKNSKTWNEMYAIDRGRSAFSSNSVMYNEDFIQMPRRKSMLVTRFTILSMNTYAINRLDIYELLLTTRAFYQQE